MYCNVIKNTQNEEEKKCDDDDDITRMLNYMGILSYDRS